MKSLKKSFLAFVAMLAIVIALPANANAQTKMIDMNPATVTGQEVQSKDQTLNAGDSTYFYLSNGYTKAEVTSWKSSNSKILKIKKYNKYYGKATALKPGKVTVTATLTSGKKYSFKVTVNKILSADESKVTVGKGKRAETYVTLNTTKKGAKISAKSANKSIATVSAGKLKSKVATLRIAGKKVGTTTITVSNNVDNEKVKIKVTVKKKVNSNTGSGDSGKTVRRALVIGQEYKGMSNALPACKTDAAAMNYMFKQTGCSSVNTIYDASASKIESAIKSTFKSAGADDVSYVYYSGHGAQDGSICSFEGYYIDTIAPSTFVGWLKNIPGKVVVILDCCYSGSYVNKDVATDALIKEFEKQDIAYKAGECCSSKFQVLTACSKTEYSYCNSYWGFFTKALTDGVGFNYTNGNKLSSAPADKNNDKKLTLNECWKYVATETANYQSAKCYPANSSFVMFKR